MQRSIPLAAGETYHVYNRGAHKQDIFTRDQDYTRFLLLLHVANGASSMDMRRLFAKYKGQTFVSIFEKEKPEKDLVDVLAYCLMPNHFHLVLRQKEENGISKYLRKVLTAYSMYFNTKYGHSGILSQGPFKSRHVDNEAYFRYIFSYVHLNPVVLIEPQWEEKGISDKDAIRKHLGAYPYSSYYDYSVGARPERAILVEDTPDFLRSQNDLEELLKWYSADELTKVRPL